MFSGRPRPWGLTSAARKLARARRAPLEAHGLDAGFDPTEDITDPTVRSRLEACIDAGLIDVLWLAVPCESVSVAWSRHGAHPFRRRWAPAGIHPMPAAWAAYAAKHNQLFEISSGLFLRQARAGKTAFAENPADVGMPGSPLFQYRRRHHVSLWITPWIRELRRECYLSWATTHMCGWLGRFHKPTTIMGSGPEASGLTYRLNMIRCIQPRHVLNVLDTKDDGSPYSPEAGEYPQLFCAYCAAWFLRQWLPAQLPLPKAVVMRTASALSFLSWFAPSAQLEKHRPKRQTCGAWVQADAAQAEQAAVSSEFEGTELATAPRWQSAHTELPPSWPEATDVLSEAVAAVRHEPLRFISRRRAEPEPAQALACRAMPQPSQRVDMPARVTYHEVQWPEGSPPRPIADHQLWLDGVHGEILAAIAAVQHACNERAAGRLVAKLEPRVFGLHLMAPFARAVVEAGGSWDASDPHDAKPLQPYSRRDPVPRRAATAFFTRWARALGWLDRDMVEQITVTGVEARSRCTRATIVMDHHGGLRQHYAEAAAAIEADRDLGFITAGRSRPQVFPFIAVARNCIRRQQWKLRDGKLTKVTKWRVTTDDSISVDGETSRNDGIDPDEWGRAGLPSGMTLAEAVAIVKAVCADMGVTASAAALEQITLWALDLSHAYRELLVQRAEWGQQCYVWADGIRLDLRCLFGTASMVEFFQRVTTFVLAVAQRRVREFDAQHPYSHARQAWLAWREAQKSAGGAEGQHCDASFVYIDDIFGLCVEGNAGSPELVVATSTHLEPPQSESTGWRVALRCFAELNRPKVHLRIMADTFVEAGWGVAVEKSQLGPQIDVLGLQCSTPGDGSMSVPEAKRQGMIEDIKAQQQPPAGCLTSDGRAAREDVEQLVGRCGHIAQVAAEAKAYLAPMHRMEHAKIVVRTKRGHLRVQPTRLLVAAGTPAAAEYQTAIAWWRAALESRISTPLAPRLVFPELGEQGVAFMFTDAARERGTGHGAYTLVRAGDELQLPYLDTRWHADVQRALVEDRLSMPAGEGIGAVVFADALAATLEGLRHLIIFTDSTAVVAALQSGNSPSPQLNFIVRWLFDRRPQLQILALHQPGKRNDGADRLSRSGSAAVLSEARAVGARPCCVGRTSVTDELARAAMQLPQR